MGKLIDLTGLAEFKYKILSLVGVNNGIAGLDSSGKIPSAQLPSYVDDVVEYADTDHFPVTGESGKIYVALDTNKTYRWSGSDYVEISPSLALGETSSSAYRGDRGKTAYDHATDSNRSTTAQSSGLYKIATTAEGHIASVATVQKSDITSLGVLDANQGSGNAGKFMKVSPTGDLVPDNVPDPTGKADKVASATSGNFAGLDANGNLTDSGKSSFDFGAPSDGIAVNVLANGWSNATPSTQTVIVQGVTSSNNINVGIGGSVTSAQLEAIAAGNILCTAQGTNSITLTCFGQVPQINIPINVIILN